MKQKKQIAIELAKEKKNLSFSVKVEDIDYELTEPKTSSLDPGDLAVNVIIYPITPNRTMVARSNNPFVLPEYWMAKGYKMQTGCQSNENLEDLMMQQQQFGFKRNLIRKDHIDQALDYYF